MTEDAKTERDRDLEAESQPDDVEGECIEDLMSKECPLLKALAEASMDDLRIIDVKIDHLKRVLASLEEARNILEKRLGQDGKSKIPTRPKTTPRRQSTSQRSEQSGQGRQSDVPDGLTEAATKIYDLVAKEGTMPPSVIAQRLGTSGQSVKITVARSNWLNLASNGEVEIVQSEK